MWFPILKMSRGNIFKSFTLAVEVSFLFISHFHYKSIVKCFDLMRERRERTEKSYFKIVLSGYHFDQNEGGLTEYRMKSLT